MKRFGLTVVDDQNLILHSVRFFCLFFDFDDHLRASLLD